MGACSSDLYSEPRAVSLQRVRSLSSDAIVPAAHMRELQEGRKLTDDFELDGQVLGQGLGGDVVLAHGKMDRQKYAMKTIRKARAAAASQLKRLTSEVEIYLTLSHPNIARLHGIYEGGGKVCLVMECCSGGELYARLQQRGIFPSGEAAEATRQMLRAVGYLHARNVVHRDLKLENFLYESEEQTAQLKLIDFGFAKVWDPDTLMTAPCGSISYVSPDVISGKGYTNKCDLWSLGVIVWMLLVGYPPFHGQERQVMQKIKSNEPDWSHKSRWKPVPAEAVNFVRKLLDKDPLRRLGAEEAIQHPWLAASLPRPRASLAGA